RVARLKNPAAAAARPKLALILSGGGARAAYQAGVARAIAEMLPDGSASPFRIVCGTSAGAINAAALAAGARHFRAASTMLCETWATLSIEDIYRADGRHLAQQDGACCARFSRAPTVSDPLRCSIMRRWR